MSDYFAKVRQGNIVSIAGDTGTTSHFVVVSQSCDASQSKRELIQLAPLVALEDPVERRAAIRRENPRFPVVTRHEAEVFADLAQIISVAKSEVEGAPRQPGACAGDEHAERAFGLAIGRWFSRFAVPDDLQPWLEPLQAVIRDKYEKPESSLGQTLSRVVELRVQADWAARPAEVTLHVIVAASEFPLSDAPVETESRGSPASSATSLDSICARLLTTADGRDKYAVWLQVAEELAKRCRPRKKYENDPQILGAVSRVVAQVWPDDEFPLSLYRKSEILDIDFLSEPTPL